ncbi:hypothetical protein RJ641_032773 [Dillenia turbinata]|uniref:Uncharacterized protein n=1 Tax=Dillenia turbinata TaxID=194707 RepID=A0AAN8VX23_9MAGN
MGGVKVATSCLHWSQPLVPHHTSPSSSRTLASAISSPSSKKQRHERLVCRFLHTKLYRSKSCELLTKSRVQTVRRACSASLDAFSDEDFSKKIQELALRFQLSAENEAEVESEDNNHHNRQEAEVGYNSFSSREAEEIENSYEASTSDFPAIIERKANSVDLPVSLRMIKRKKQKWQEGLREAGESAYCSIKKAFSSMVFIIRELHSYSLQMREVLFYEDLQGILTRVQREMHASFVWLFQQVFSHTPTLMVYVMILLANFTVHSMATNPAIAASACVPKTESVSMSESQNHQNQKFDSSAIKSFSVSNSAGKSTSIGGNNGGGGKIRPPAVSGTDGEGRFDRSSSASASSTVPGVSSVGTSWAESVSGQVTGEQELSPWNKIVEEANRMQGALRDESLDSETLRKFVSPVNAKIEADDYTDYFITELQYQTGLAQDPNNSLLLANYAQFLSLVVRDYDRAEEYFKRAIGVEPGDAEAYSKYASFLWLVKKDLMAAEETYLEAISADPTNTHFAANYAHFLWSTGGEDTCFPLSSPDSDVTTPTNDF